VRERDEGRKPVSQLIGNLMVLTKKIINFLAIKTIIYRINNSLLKKEHKIMYDCLNQMLKKITEMV
jgi:hypothetical protein